MSRISWLVVLLVACAGDPGPIVDASREPDAPPMIDGGMCEGTLPFMDTCADDGECETCTCHAFGRGSFCTHECDGPEDCPPPSTGCGGIGLCRPPQ